jgi:hypothetical protein
MMNFTGRCGQACVGVCACAGVAATAGIPQRAMTRVAARRFHMLIIVPHNPEEWPKR